MFMTICKSSGIVCHVNWEIVTDISQKHTDSIFRVKKSAYLDCLTLKLETPHSSKDWQLFTNWYGIFQYLNPQNFIYCVQYTVCLKSTKNTFYHNKSENHVQGNAGTTY